MVAVPPTSFARPVLELTYTNVVGVGVEKIEGKLQLEDRKPNVWSGLNHNWLRITRVLRSLTLLDLKAEANEFFALLTELRDTGTVAINDETWRYWKKAVGQ